MSETAADYRKYLDPRTLARISSLDLRGPADRRRADDRHAPLAVPGHLASSSRSTGRTSPGDDIRHVDWKVFGKTDKIYLKQYLEETNLHLICVVDASESMGYGTVKSRRHARGPSTTTPPPSPRRCRTWRSSSRTRSGWRSSTRS